LLERLETKLAEKVSNVELALRTVSSIYERSLQQRTDRVLDGITALEALLPTKAELAFTLAYRVAGLLAADEDARVEYFNSMKAHYRTRSKIVHGLSLNNNDRALIQDDEPLRSIVRQLLVGFLHLAETGEIDRTAKATKFYEQRLDADLLHAQRRTDLRETMKLA